jgi:DNA-binding HxlR family transcriptional regulator
MKRTQELPPKCPRPTHELLQLLTRPWTMHVLWALSSGGPTRFGALRRQIEGISSRLLTERLRTLEEKGFIYRHYEPTIPPAVTYGLTKRMEEIGEALEKLDDLARKWQAEDAKAPRKRTARA